MQLPAFFLARRPEDPIIIASYGASLAHRMSRHARAIVESAEFAELFPGVRTNPASRAVDHWELAPPHRGGLVAAGVGGPITGHGAALGVIDDPFENWERAYSETVRDKTWEWWKGTFRTRVWEDGAIVLMTTRWHEDDLAGRLLAEQAGEWRVLRLPALAETDEERDHRDARMHLPTGSIEPLRREPGEALCPSRFSVKALEQIRRDVGSMVWSAEYQGAPTLPEGNRFKRAWFSNIVDAESANVRRGRYWDLAATEGGGARTAGVLMAIDREGNVYIEDVKIGQWSTGERNAVIRQNAQLDHQRYGNHGRMWFEEEPGSSGKDASAALVKYLAGFTARPDRPTGDKDVRLEPFAAQAEAGNVRLVRGDWNGRYIEEMCAVPAGRYRDQADATAGAYNRLSTGGLTVASGADIYKRRAEMRARRNA